MNIKHNPIFDTGKVARFYSEKDGVDVKYVCTSAISEHGCNAYDIFYRETPHPEFGNRYFGLSWRDKHIVITNADNIEKLVFHTILDENANQWVYSQHRHDVRSAGDTMIDGGRSYRKLIGNIKTVKSETFKIQNGNFIKDAGVNEND